MKEYEFRSTLAIRRLPFTTLLKIFFIAGLGFSVPFCGLMLLVAIISPASVRLEEGQTITQFILVALASVVLGPAIIALHFGTAAWIVMGVKGLFSPTYIEIVRDDRDLAREHTNEPAGFVANVQGSSRSPVSRVKWSAVLVAVTAVVAIAACYFAFAPKRVSPVPHMSIESPNGAFVAVTSTVAFGPDDMRTVLQSVHIVGKDEFERHSKSGAKTNWEIEGNTVASIHSCGDDDIDVSWTSDTALLIRYSQTKPDWVASVSSAGGVSVTLESIQNSGLDPPSSAARID